MSQPRSYEKQKIRKQETDEMVIVRMQGGLGNQLFQYALYEAIRSQGTEVRADLSDYTSHRDARDYELGKLGLCVQEADRRELHRFYADNTRMRDRAFRYTIGRGRYRKEKCYDYEPWVLQTTEGYLSGYWQSERYFRHISGKLRSSITFQNIDTPDIRYYEEQMQGEHSVSIHLRRGDYEQNRELYGEICTPEYYRRAVQSIREQVQDPVFYIFSDDPEWGEHLIREAGVDRMCTVQGHTGANAYKDLYLMSRCRHHIIANSTFSWWGAWLDGREGKLVITPPRWNHLCKEHEICAQGWSMIS